LLLALDSERFSVIKSGGGCLGGSSAGGYKSDARAFAVALVKPSQAVSGCPGLCLIALHSPHINITQGADTVSAVCGDNGRKACTIAVGDFNAPIQKRPLISVTVAERLKQLLGHESGPVTVAAPDVNTCCYPETKYLGIDDHVATNIPDAMLVHAQVFPYQLKLSKDTEEHMPIAVSLDLPSGSDFSPGMPQVF
jgi:hypothetical protein